MKYFFQIICWFQIKVLNLQREVGEERVSLANDVSLEQLLSKFHWKTSFV